MTYARYKVKVTARKAWMFFDDEIVVMTSGLDAENADESNDVVTSVCQEAMTSGVSVRYGDDKFLRFSKGKHDFPKPKWLHHNSTAYIFLKGIDNLETRATRHFNKPDGTTDIVTAYVNHGAKPMDKNFAYIIKPSTTKFEMLDDYVRSLPIEIIRNDRAVQAVFHKGLSLTEIVFYDTDKIMLPTGK